MYRLFKFVNSVVFTAQFLLHCLVLILQAFHLILQLSQSFRHINVTTRISLSAWLIFIVYIGRSLICHYWKRLWTFDAIAIILLSQKFAVFFVRLGCHNLHWLWLLLIGQMGRLFWLSGVSASILVRQACQITLLWDSLVRRIATCFTRDCTSSCTSATLDRTSSRVVRWGSKAMVSCICLIALRTARLQREKMIWLIDIFTVCLRCEWSGRCWSLLCLF